MYPSAFETVAMREAAGIIWLIIEINCEHVLSRVIPLRNLRATVQFEKASVKDGGGRERRWRGRN